MSTVTQADIKTAVLGWGKVPLYICDEKDCGRFIMVGELYKVTKGTVQKPLKVQCVRCQYWEDDKLRQKQGKLPRGYKVPGLGRTKTKVSAKQAEGVELNPIIRRVALRILKAAGREGLPVEQFRMKLLKKKVIRELSKKEFSRTIKGMRKLKLFRRKGANFVLPKEKFIAKLSTISRGIAKASKKIKRVKV